MGEYHLCKCDKYGNHDCQRPKLMRQAKQLRQERNEAREIAEVGRRGDVDRKLLEAARAEGRPPIERVVEHLRGIDLVIDQRAADYLEELKAQRDEARKEAVFYRNLYVDFDEVNTPTVGDNPLPWEGTATSDETAEEREAANLAYWRRHFPDEEVPDFMRLLPPEPVPLTEKEIEFARSFIRAAAPEDSDG